MSTYHKVSFTHEQVKAVRENVAGGNPDPERERRVDAMGTLRKRLGRRPTGDEVTEYLAASDA